MNIFGDIDPLGKIDKLVDNIAEKVSDSLGKIKDRVQDKVNDKAERIRAFRSEASRMASLANKRLDRLELNGLENSPAYRGYLAKGGKKFSVRGKSYQEVQAEVARIKSFIDSNTSTVRGVNEYLKDMAKNTGIQYKNLTDLKEKTAIFFELSAKIEEYHRTVDDMASAIGYNKIWEEINLYVEANNIDLSKSNRSVEEMVDDITKAITEFEKPEYINFSDIQGAENDMFYTLPKE
jgi:outer membrane murein-binding lipoprotein Lpp